MRARLQDIRNHCDSQFALAYRHCQARGRSCENRPDAERATIALADAVYRPGPAHRASVLECLFLKLKADIQFLRVTGCSRPDHDGGFGGHCIGGHLFWMVE
jgi:hypothetical protein